MRLLRARGAIAQVVNGLREWPDLPPQFLLLRITPALPKWIPYEGRRPAQETFRAQARPPTMNMGLRLGSLGPSQPLQSFVT